MSEIDLDAIEARANAATPGPWRYLGKNRIDTPVIDVDEANWGGEELSGYRLICADDDGAWRYADVEFIAHARADVPALVARVRELHAAVEQVRAECDRLEAMTTRDNSQRIARDLAVEHILRALDTGEAP